jgi:YhcH/YjgK/YiaL family protein
MIDCLVHAERYYHYIINGTKEMGWRPVSICTQVDQAYDTERDIGFFKNAPESWTKVSPGSFVIFFPEDAHTPLVSNGEIHKAVLKTGTSLPLLPFASGFKVHGTT